ncbi:hypothetical protein DPMN_016144 [Dreissena polymorpha]|uniref:Uncharacterized protein n=1 Tax=Dreissena polymorpha TaxID=45954 RepID=A0A9D4NF16_DREPO|nr:hypothetical protein DPMN_016144 [Dreissena polymorpha]
MTKFHKDWTINVTSRNCLAPWTHVFQWTGTIFKLSLAIIRTNVLTKWPYIIRKNVLTKFHEDWTKNKTSRVLTRKTAPPTGGYIIGTNVLTKFHEDWTINVTSRFRTQPRYHWENLLTKFHEDQTIDVASRVLTRQNVDDVQHTTNKMRSQKLTMSTLCSHEHVVLR